MTGMPAGDLPFLLHLCAVGVASWFSCAGGWVFGTGRLRKGVVLGILGIAAFLVDHWIFD